MLLNSGTVIRQPVPAILYTIMLDQRAPGGSVQLDESLWSNECRLNAATVLHGAPHGDHASAWEDDAALIERVAFPKGHGDELFSDHAERVRRQRPEQQVAPGGADTELTSFSSWQVKQSSLTRSDYARSTGLGERMAGLQVGTS